MRPLIFACIASSIVFLESCYSVEDADDVNQERIAVYYQTDFNATRGTTSTRIDFRFGQTPLKMDHPVWFNQHRMYEQKDIITGLHYERQVLGTDDGWYEWTDERVKSYVNSVHAFDFHLDNQPKEFQKFTYYNLAWSGELIPYEAGNFSITIKSHVDGSSCTFNSGEIIAIDSHHLDFLPYGDAKMIITRHHSEPIDEGTQAGGESHVSYKREYEIRIVE